MCYCHMWSGSNNDVYTVYSVCSPPWQSPLIKTMKPSSTFTTGPNLDQRGGWIQAERAALLSEPALCCSLLSDPALCCSRCQAQHSQQYVLYAGLNLWNCHRNLLVTHGCLIQKELLMCCNSIKTRHNTRLMDASSKMSYSCAVTLSRPGITRVTHGCLIQRSYSWSYSNSLKTSHSMSDSQPP